MALALWEMAAAREAEALILELGIKALPVCPFTVARGIGLVEVKPLPASSRRGVSGMLLRYGNVFGIMYSTFLGNLGFQNFSIGHEIGHFRLAGHSETVLRDGVHTSYAGFVSTDRYELEADHFSAALLMPSALFDGALDKVGRGLDAVENLAGQCITSLTATAIRYAQRTPDAAAIVVSEGRSIDYCFMSASLREVRGLDWIKRGSAVPHASVTHRFNTDQASVARRERADGVSNLDDWFGGSLAV